MNNTINPPLNPSPEAEGEILTVKGKTNVKWKKNI